MGAYTDLSGTVDDLGDALSFSTFHPVRLQAPAHVLLLRMEWFLASSRCITWRLEGQRAAHTTPCTLLWLTPAHHLHPPSWPAGPQSHTTPTHCAFCR